MSFPFHRFARRRLAGLGLTGLISVQLALAQEPPTREQTLQVLEGRRQRQMTAAAAYKTFHDFHFTDGYEASGIRFEHQVVEDAGKYWKPAHYDHGCGLAVADVDGDGRLDLYFVSQLGRCELWRNTGHGRFEDITASSGAGLTDVVGVAAAFADVDNDGRPDLFVTTVRHGNRLFLNQGGGKFREATAESGLAHSAHSSGVVFFDYDRDGRLDLLVCDVGVYTTEEKGPGGFFRAIADAFGGHTYPERTEYKVLYHNEGGGKFKDVTEAMGLRDGGWCGEATFCDLNEDGFPDLYLTNMQGDDRYYENQGGKKFVEKTAALFPKTPWGAMGVKFFDFNNDGKMDGYVTDMHSDMTPQQTLDGFRFLERMEREKSERYCSARWDEKFLQGSSNNVFGNAFYVNLGGGKFAERSDALGLETYWPWGPSVGDLNADGFEDVFVTAGMGYPFRFAPNSLLLNEGGERFVEAEYVVGVEPRAQGRVQKVFFTLDCDGADARHPLSQGRSGRLPIDGSVSSRSAALIDLDDDGDLDIVTNEQNDHPMVLVSDLAQRRPVHFLKVRLVGTRSNRDGLGATVVVHSGDRKFTRYHDGKSGYLAQSLIPLYFGLGEAMKADRVEVAWPSGTRQTVTSGIPANGMLVITEPR